jgi:putative transposase
LWKAARRAGHDIGRDQVARLMRQAGIRGMKRGRRVITTRRDDNATRSPDLVKRNFTAERPNALWVTDLERHEALLNPAVMKGHRLRLVAASQ